jgi:glycerol kinase
MTQYVAAIDQGTTSTRCMIFDRSGSPIARRQLEHRQIYPRPGWVEHNPLEIWANAQAVIAGALQQAGLRAADIAAIGVTNQRETTVVWVEPPASRYVTPLSGKTRAPTAWWPSLPGKTASTASGKQPACH